MAEHTRLSIDVRLAAVDPVQIRDASFELLSVNKQEANAMAERYQVRGLRIWDSETDTYSKLFQNEGHARHIYNMLLCGKHALKFQPLSEWQDDKPASDAVEQPASDPVNNPSHYTQSGIQCDDAIRAMLGPEGYSAYVRGTMLAYM